MPHAVRSISNDLTRPVPIISNLSIFYTQTTMSTCKPQSPATEALQKALTFVPNHVISTEKPMIQANAMKRSRSTLGSFGMADFEDAANQVEESIAFPSIEWNFDGDEEEFTQPSKRRCQGLSRSNESFDLMSLGSFQKRRGSNGSLC